MKIDRSERIREVIAFFQQDHGVVIGNPGVGKTYLLSEVVSELLVNQGIGSTMISLNYLSDGTDADINQSLGISDQNWLEALKAIRIPDGKKGVLIFDGYDIIKDETLKEAVTRQIAKAKRELPNWSIAVSVRTYDAAKSQKLIDLFAAEHNSDGIHCRRFVIPILSEDEIDRFLATEEKLNAVYRGGSEKLRTVLRVPFFLSLLKTILDRTTATIDELSALQTEIELLEMYWVKVIDNIRPTLVTNLLLKELTEEMIEKRSLSVNRMEFLSGMDMEKIRAAERLLGENVLAEQGSGVIRLAYSHNIFFDYAVSKLILKDSAADILTFISADPSRPFFLRPSFIYFFARLWHKDPARFWAIYHELSASSDEIVSLFNKLISSSVIAREFESANEIHVFDAGNELRVQQIQNILQAVRINGRQKTPEILLDLLEKVSSDLQLPFVGDFTVILEQLTEDPAVKSSPTLFDKCGLCSRHLMDFLIAHRGEGNVEQFAAYRGTKLVGKTYATDVPGSRERLEVILDMLETPGFPIAYIQTLTGCIREIAEADAEFAAKVYDKVFTHREDSHEHNESMATVRMSFSFTRHDQYSTCKFQLKQFFPVFLPKHPEIAIPLALRIVNTDISQKAESGFQIPEDQFKLPTEFDINGVRANYRFDLSSLWSQSISPEATVEFTGDVMSFFESLIASGEHEKLSEHVALYMQHAFNAYNWNELLKLGTRYPAPMSEALYGLLLQPSILYWWDTKVEAVNFLEAASAYYSEDQLHAIEREILGIPGYLSDDKQKSGADTVELLISRIPKNRLKEDAAIAISKNSAAIPNEPLVTFGTSSSGFTEIDLLREAGVATEESANIPLVEIHSRLKGFTNEFMNNVPDRGALAGPLQEALVLYNTVFTPGTEPIQPELSETLLITITDVAAIALKSHRTFRQTPILTAEELTAAEKIVLHGLRTHTDQDVYAEQHYNPGSIYNHTARSNAARALPSLFGTNRDTALLPLIEEYSKDKNSITRLGVLRGIYVLYADHKQLMWKIIQERVLNEPNTFVKGQVIASLTDPKFYKEDSEAISQIIEIAYADVLKITAGHSSVAEGFFWLALGYYRETGDEPTHDILLKVLKANQQLSHTGIITAFQIISPESFHRDFNDQADIDKSQRLIALFSELLDFTETILLTSGTPDEDPEQTKQAFHIIDQFIQRIYFAMQVNPSVMANSDIKITPEHRQKFYFLANPLLIKMLEISRKLGGGFIHAHSAHYFIELMEAALRFDTAFALSATSEITAMTARTNYTFDPGAIENVVRFTERMLADHKDLLAQPAAFKQIMNLLSIYVKSGWPQALDLLGKMDEIFR